MSGVRRSSGLTNLVADTLRFRDLSGGLLTLSDRGVVRNDSSPALQTLTVNGKSHLHDTTDSGTLTTNSVNVLASATIGHMDASSASLNSLNVTSATVNQINVSSAVINYLPQFDPSGNMFSLLPDTASKDTVIANINLLLNLFANKNIFITLSPTIIFQTELRIGISEFPTGDPNNFIFYNYTFNIGARSLHDIINTLNNQATIKLRFSINNSHVSIREAPGFSFTFQDVSSSANLFLNHIGLLDISCNPTVPFYPYISLIGERVLDMTGQLPAVPAVPTALPTAENITDDGFTIVLPIITDPAVKQIGLYIKTSPSETAQWEAWLPSTVTSYRFNTPTITENTRYNIYISYLSKYDEGSRSAGVLVDSHNLFNIMDSRDISPIAPSEYSRATKSLDSWPAELTRVSQIYSIILTIGYRVDPYSTQQLETILKVNNTINTISIFTNNEFAPYTGGIATGGIVGQTYLYNDFREWFPTTDGDTIDKTKPLSFDWNFADGQDDLPTAVGWIGPDIADACIINYSYT
jgi:hypothetical protein